MNGTRFSDKREDSCVLLLGGAGYLGSVLVGKLLASGRRVRVLDSFMFGEQSLNQVRAHPQCELVRGDVRDVGIVVKCMQGCETVIHLAAIVGDSACDENQQLAMEVNWAATRMLTDVALECGVRRFVFASSCSVYGASDFFLNEASPVNPLSMYAEMKLESETILLKAKSTTFAPSILRLGTLFGLSPRMRFDLVVNLFVAHAVSMRRIAILNGAQWRPLIHVRDAAQAFVTCLEAATHTVSGEVFNVGAAQLNLQIEQLGRAVARVVAGTEIEMLQNEDRRNYRVTFDKIHERLGFSYSKTMQYGIQEIYGAILAGRISDFTTAQFNNQIALRALVRAGAKQSSPLREITAPVSSANPANGTLQGDRVRSHAVGL